MSHFLGEDFVFISSIQGVAVILIIIMDRNKCIQAEVLTQSVFLLFCIGICWCELRVFSFFLSNSISNYAKWEQQEMA